MGKKFRGMQGGGNMQKMLKQAKKMQKDLMQSQEKLQESEFEGTAAGGMVKIILSGNNEIKKLKLEEDIVDPEDVELLEDSIIAAFNDAQKKLTQESEKNLGGLTQGLNIPGLF